MKLKSLFAVAGLLMAMAGNVSADINLVPNILKNTATEFEATWSLSLADLPQASQLEPVIFTTAFAQHYGSNWNISIEPRLVTVFDGEKSVFGGLDGGFTFGRHVAVAHDDDGIPDYVLGYLPLVLKGSWSQQLAANHQFSHSDIYTFGAQQTAQGYEYSVSAIHAVPEPETYAMLLAGLGVVGWRLRGRKS